MRKLIPVILALIGLAGGGAAGFFLRPPPEAHVAADASATPEPVPAAEDTPPEGEQTVEYVKLNNQFVVPVVTDKMVSALVIMSLSLEVGLGMTEKVYAAEPKIRDALLQVLFDHANAGGFEGAFTATANMEALRAALLEAVHGVLGSAVHQVLVSDIIRQDTR